MTYIATNPRKYENKSVGSGQCVAFVQAVTQAGMTRNWKRGELVMGATLPVGTAIATFNEDGHYANDALGRSHAAIYLGQTAAGIRVLDQWLDRGKQPDGTVKVGVNVVQERIIYFQPRSVKDVDDGRKYYVIE